MTIEATAEALATEQVATPEISEDQELEAIFDRQGEEPPAEDPPQEPKAKETDEAPDAEDAQEVEVEQPVEEPAPSELPRAIRDAWKDIPESARAAFVDAQREANRKLGEQGRLIQGINPIKDVLVKAAQELPALQGMKPQQVAQEVFHLARISNDLASDPVKAITTLAQQKGFLEPLKQALAGQQVTSNEPQLRQHIAKLERQLSEFQDPETWRERVTQITQESQVQNEVTTFSQTAEHWADVEDYMPAAVQLVKQAKPNASPKDVLSEAYDLALRQFKPDALKAPQPAADEAASTVDPEKAKAALKAKSVNVTSRPTGKARTLSEDEELAAIWSRSQA